MTVPAPAAPATPAATPPAGAATPPAASGGATPPAQAPEDQRKQVPISELHREREKRQGIQSELDQLKESVQQMKYGEQPNVQQQQFQQQQQMPQDATVQQLNSLWQGNDPRAAVQAEIQVAFDWYDRQNAMMDIQEAQAAQKYTDFGNYRNQVRGWVRQLPTAQRAKPGVFDLAYNAVKGSNVDGLIKAAQQDLINKLNAGEQIQGLTGGAIPGSGGGGGAGSITEQERVAANAMGLSEEDYVKNKK